LFCLAQNISPFVVFIGIDQVSVFIGEGDDIPVAVVEVIVIGAVYFPGQGLMPPDVPGG